MFFDISLGILEDVITIESLLFVSNKDSDCSKVYQFIKSKLKPIEELLVALFNSDILISDASVQNFRTQTECLMVFTVIINIL